MLFCCLLNSVYSKDLEKGWCFVGPDLLPNCLQRLSVMAKLTTSSETVEAFE